MNKGRFAGYVGVLQNKLASFAQLDADVTPQAPPEADALVTDTGDTFVTDTGDTLVVGDPA